MLNWGLPINLCLALLLVGCSFQANHPAPVESLSRKQAKHHQSHIKAEVYKVKKGDTLYSISFAAGKDFTEIAKINQLDKSYTIYPGQVLRLTESPIAKSSQATSSTAKVSRTNGSVEVKTVENQRYASNSPQSAASGTSTKKTLDQKAKPEYSATSSRQIVNREASTLPVDVSQWQWPARGKLVGAYSANEQGNKGIKIAGQRGDIIKAAADGRVVYAGNALRGYGNLVIIKHSEDYLSAYAHADQILVEEKQNVLVGQTIAKMGSTGTNQVMLRFEIRYHGQSVNPLNYLPKQ